MLALLPFILVGMFCWDPEEEDLYHTVLYCTVLYCTVLYCIAASHPIYLILLPVCTVQYQVVEAQSVIDDQQQVLSSKSLITT